MECVCRSCHNAAEPPCPHSFELLMTDKKSGITQHEDVGQDYLERRKLRKSAGWVLLWALGVGAVISGDFGGWNYGLQHGGFGGLAIGTVLMALMYVCMVYTIAELSAALPHAGGFFSFTRNAFGPTGGFICGLTDAIEYVITPAVIVTIIGGYMQTLIPGIPAYVWWILFYAVFVGINIAGVELTLKAGLVVTLIAMAVLLVFYVSTLALGKFEAAALTNIEPDSGANRWLPHGFRGVLATLPFAIWFYLAIEQLPLAAEEAHNVAKDMPKALILGIMTLLVLSLFTLVLNTGVEGGAAKIGSSDAPLADGFQAVFGIGATSKLMTVIALTGLVASFHTIIYAYGRVLFALSRAGYIPRWISLTGTRHTPYMALLLGAVVGLMCAAAIEFTKTGPPSTEAEKTTAESIEFVQDDPPSAKDLPAAEEEKITVSAVLLNMAVFGAVISYTMVMFSYIKLRISRPDLPRPYKSPLGIPGAAVGAILSIVALVATFSIEDYQPGVIGVAVFIVVGIIYFVVYSRHHLVAQAPEEENALIAHAEDELAHK